MAPAGEAVDTRNGTCCEIIPDRFYFLLLHNSSVGKPHSTLNIHYFCIDDTLTYSRFYSDFGPLDLAKLYRYCSSLNKKLTAPALAKKKIVHFTGSDPQKRVNAAFLVGAYAVIYLGLTPQEAYKLVVSWSGVPYLPFRDASMGPSLFHLNLLDCLQAISKAQQYGFLNFDKFDCGEYEHYEKVENGDMNWIIPTKILAFSGPQDRNRTLSGYPVHSPTAYLPYFHKNNIKAVIRLNKKMYDSKQFLNDGIEHYDLFFPDGSTPSDSIVQRFFAICDKVRGAMAIHCKAGLGRTGTLIGLYLMKYYKFTAAEAIAWLRITRPGSVIGPQQTYLEQKQPIMWAEGDEIRRRLAAKKKASQDATCRVSRSGQESQSGLIRAKVESNMSCDSSGQDWSSSYSLPSDSGRKKKLTQGDHLNRLKNFRNKETSRVASIKSLTEPSVNMIHPSDTCTVKMTSDMGLGNRFDAFSLHNTQHTASLTNGVYQSAWSDKDYEYTRKKKSGSQPSGYRMR